jgi:hypothetical protein
MSSWTFDELDAIAAATELRISTRRPDGTLRPAVPIWVVRAEIRPGLPRQIRQLRPCLRRTDDRRSCGRGHAPAHPATLKGPWS